MTAATVSGWRDHFLAAGQSALKTRQQDARDEEVMRLKGQDRRHHDGERTAARRAEEVEAEGYRKVWLQLRGKEVKVGKRRVLRLMREANLLSPSRSFKLAVAKQHDGRITTDQPDEMRGTDQTSTLTAQGQACVFIAVDHCTAERLGIHATRRGNRFEALEAIRQGVRSVFGSYEATVAVGLKLRHDQTLACFQSANS